MSSYIIIPLSDKGFMTNITLTVENNKVVFDCILSTGNAVSCLFLDNNNKWLSESVINSMSLGNNLLQFNMFDRFPMYLNGERPLVVLGMDVLQRCVMHGGYSRVQNRNILLFGVHEKLDIDFYKAVEEHFGICLY